MSSAMELGVIGLGKMGGGILRRLSRGGHRVVGFDADPATVAALHRSGFEVAASVRELSEALSAPEVIWLMVPCGSPVDETLAALLGHLRPGATILDGGNSNYRDTLRRHRDLAARGLTLLDVGTSGGVRGEADGYCLMIGGERDRIRELGPIFETLAPDADQGWGRVGPAGAGHFVKMIHNGIEYGMMQALAEGFAIMEAKAHQSSQSPAPDFDLDLGQIARIWNRGSVVRSWLLELTAVVLSSNPSLGDLRSAVDDSGEGRWTVQEAIDLNVAAPVITDALLARIQSRDPDAFSAKLLSALRNQFGGHADRNPPVD
jgi:6-phosphogluconate dehydrogenase